MILVDAGPLVALLLRTEAEHPTCVRVLEGITEPLVSVWPALTEAAYLLRVDPRGRDALLDWVQRGVVRALPLDSDDIDRTRQLLRKYEDLPMDFADACLVRVAERDGLRTVFTLDRRDFEVYRPRGIGRFRIIP